MNRAQRNIDYLTQYCQDLPELYNKVALKLWSEFDITGAEISLLCTFMVNEFMEDHK